MTEMMVPVPPDIEAAWDDGDEEEEEEAFTIAVLRPYEAEDGEERLAPVPLTMDWGDGNTLVMFTQRELAEQFVASETFKRVDAGIVKGQRAEAFIRVLEVCVEYGWIENVLVNPNPFHEWQKGNVQGEPVDAAGLLAHLKEVYRDFLDD